MRIAIAPIFGLILTTASASPNWETYQGNHQRTGRSDTTIDSSRLQRLWTSQWGYAGARIVGDRIFATFYASNGMRIDCFNAQNGRRIWGRSLGSLGFVGGIEVFGDYVAVSAGTQGQSQLQVFRADSGQVMASIGQLDSTSTAPLARRLNNGVWELTLATSNGASQFWFNGNSLSQTWRRSLALGGWVTPSRIDDVAILGGVGNFYAVDLATGEVNQFYQGSVSGGGGASAVIDAHRRTFYIRETLSTGLDGAMFAYRFDGFRAIHPLWTKQLSDRVGSPVLLENGDLLVADAGRLHRIDARTGSTLLSSTDLGIYSQSPFVSQGVAWVGTNSNALALSLTTLQPIETLPSTPGAGFSGELNPVLASSRFLVTQSPHGGGGFRQGLVVYAVPEPRAAIVFAGALLLLIRRRRPSS